MFQDAISKRERRHVKHGLADVETHHSSQRKVERRNLSTRAVSVCAGGKRVVKTHLPTGRECASPRPSAAPTPCAFVHCATSSHSAGKIIGRGGVNVQPLRSHGVRVRIERNELTQLTQCIVEGGDEARVLAAFEKLQALLRSLDSAAAWKAKR